MLKVGTQNISGLYAGSEKVKKAYLGTALVFDTGGSPGPDPGPSRLPEGYTEVEYIQTSGYCQINTGITLQAAVGRTIVMDFEPISATGSGYLFYAYKSGTTIYRCCAYFTGSAINANMGTGSANATIISNPPLEKTRLIYNASSAPSIILDGIETEMQKVSASIGSYSATFQNYGWTSGIPAIKLLSSGSTNYVTAKLYSCRFFKQSYNSTTKLYTAVPERDFVPCIDPSGAVGLYDLVEDKFYANSGTGTLSAGPAV